MSYRGIKRVLGESSLERKIHILFAIFFLSLIATAFMWVNSITEEIILRNTRSQAKGLVSDYILRTHLKNPNRTPTDDGTQRPGQLGTNFVYEAMATEPPSIPYEAELVTLDDQSTRNVTSPQVAVQEDEVRVLQQLVNVAVQLQEEQNALEAIKLIDNEAYREAIAEYEARQAERLAATAESDELPDTDGFFQNRERYYYYAPLVFKSNSSCLTCHFPGNADAGSLSQKITETNDPETLVKLRKQQLDTPSPMFVRITLDNTVARQAVIRSRAILISVTIVVAAVAVAMLWTIVRYVIVKPLAHLRDVTEEISHGNTDVRAQINTGDEFEELSRSFNRMLRHVLDTQSALQDANEVLDHKVSEQAQLNYKLHEMNQIKSEFMANMSHELRTPLNSIIGFSELLENASGLNDKQLRFASNIRNSGRLLLDLINDILDLAKLEAGKMEIRPSEFSTAQLISELCEMVTQLARSKNIRLDHQADPDWPPLHQDRTKVQQILTNLLSNAIKFTPEGGRIRVRASRVMRPLQPVANGTEPRETVPWLVIDVEDTGVGISPADQEIVFEKFRQGPSALGRDGLTREVSGTGLGLSIVKEICSLLGGEIGLESEVGRGSVFTVRLPWHYRDQQPIQSELSDGLQRLAKSQRVDLARATLTPVPPPADGD